MSGTATFQPKFGRRVRHRDGRLFAAEGEAITLDTFYRRLIADGDLIPVAPAKNETKPARRSRKASKGPSS